jgi:hypothetical protein
MIKYYLYTEILNVIVFFLFSTAILERHRTWENRNISFQLESMWLLDIKVEYERNLKLNTKKYERNIKCNIKKFYSFQQQNFKGTQIRKFKTLQPYLNALET